MGNLVLSFLFDFGLAVLLIATIAYCARLSRRIRLLQDSRGELAEMIARFDEATGRATASVTELQALSKRITDALQLKIEKANFLADDLAFMIEKSTKLVTQLEAAKKPAPPAEKPAAVLPPAAAPQAPQHRPFFETLPSRSSAPTHAPDVSADTRARMASSLEAVLQRLASSAAASDRDEPAPREIAQVPRTEAERELIEALKAGR